MKKIALVFGGVSVEHDISLLSATTVINKINKDKYDIDLIYIDKAGIWYFVESTKLEDKSVIENVFETLRRYDIIFPILHGKNGEDGTIQGMFELLNKKYIGCKVLSSSLCMDKVYSKMIFEYAGFNQAKYLYLKYINKEYYYFDEKLNDKKVTYKEIDKLIKDSFNYPVMIKPSCGGSSIGINKANNKKELEKYLKETIKYDNKILIEEFIIGKEIECAILEDKKIIASTPGEILANDVFYSYDAKYNSSESKTLIPSTLTEEVAEEVKKLAIKAFKTIDGKDLARVDFFVDKNNKIYLNEINTIPGFTDISMYLKLFSYDNIDFTKLLDKLINNN